LLRSCLYLFFEDKNENGKVIVPWPGTVLHYYAATEIVRWEDFKLVHENPDERYGTFGNGVTQDGFVPHQFPWVHHPPNGEKAERKPDQAAQLLVTTSNVLVRVKSQVMHTLGSWAPQGTKV
jgi:hypothetical protein